ncbi:hypothetical protein Btru_009236 [Bulinus truncatus]|nr:hypothetical protein Btru_009236 [Bulinus truncatus]
MDLRVSLAILLVVFIADVEGVFNMDLNSNYIISGLSRYLDILCRFTKEVSSTIDVVTSLELSYSSSSNPPDFKEVLATVDQAGEVKSIPADGLKSTGTVNQTGESYLRLTWNNIRTARAGVYQCKANGLNRLGKPLSTVKQEEVKLSSPTLELVSNEIRKLMIYTEGLQSKLLSVNNRFEKARDAFFIGSQVFNGSRYWIPRSVLGFTIDEAQTNCELIAGGYLAEPNTNEEYEFMREFVQNVDDNNYEWIYIGAKDVNPLNIRDRKFLGMDSQTALGGLKWSLNEPNNKNEPCAEMQRDRKYYLNDYLCVVRDAGNNRKYLCETKEV